MKGRFLETLIKREYNIMPTNVDLTKYTSPKKVRHLFTGEET